MNITEDSDVTSVVLGELNLFSDRFDGETVSWTWNFGDGGTSASQNANHQYLTAGTYNVTLTVTTAAGSITNMKPNYITVMSGAGAAAAQFVKAAANEQIPAEDTSTGTVVAVPAYQRSSADEQNSTKQLPPVRMFGSPEPSSVHINLTNTIADGSTTNMMPNYIPVRSGAAANEQIPAEDTSTGTVIAVPAYQRSFADEQNSTKQLPPVRMFGSPEPSSVSLNLMNTSMPKPSVWIGD
ncbi:MAG: hypothetical protein STSR0009_15510 [Methanoregula sp.]